jgi:hypothetical protein
MTGMKNLIHGCMAAAALAVGAPALVHAHFTLMEPASWLVENRLGDPQKLGPCGGTSADAGMPTNAISNVQGNSKLHIKLLETVFHPGHYRIALAVNSRTELPPDPEVVTRDSERGPWSVSATIDKSPKAPVLADGLFVHTAKPTDPFETDVQLPNITCKKCTLQIVQFMAEHGYNKDGGYYYHHCADLQITADPKAPLDARWPPSR